MNRFFQIRYEILHETFTAEELISSYNLPLNHFESDFLDLPVLDIGIGMGVNSLHFASRGKKVVSVDNDDFIIEKFKEKINLYHQQNCDRLNVTILKQEFPALDLTESRFSCILLSNILHFLSTDLIHKAMIEVDRLLPIGGLVYISAHSTAHPANNPSKRGAGNSPHFFTEDELKELVTAISYQILYFNHYYKLPSEKEIEINKKWYQQYCIDQYLEHAKRPPTEPELEAFFQRNLSIEPDDSFILIGKKIS